MRPGRRAIDDATATGEQRLRVLAAALEQVRDGVAVVDGAGQIVEVNDPLCVMTGYTAEELVGTRFPYPFSVGQTADELAPGEDGRPAERTLRRKDGHTIQVSMTSREIEGSDGRSVGRAILVVDRSEALRSARLEETAREVAAASVSGELDSEQAVAQVVAERLAELLATATAGVIRFDLEAQMATLVGHRGRQEAPPPFSLKEPSVAGEVARTGRHARVEGHGSPGSEMAKLSVEREFPPRAIGAPVWIDGRLWGCVAASADGFSDADEILLDRFAKLVASSIANVQAHVRLRERAVILDSLHDGLVVIGPDGRITEVNEPLCQMTGFDFDQLVGSASPYPFSGDLGSAEMAVTESGGSVEWKLRRRDGSPLYVAASVGELDSPDGSRRGRAAVLTDISESVFNSRSERALSEVAAACAERQIDTTTFFDTVTTRVSELLDAPAVLVRFGGGLTLALSTHGELPTAIGRLVITGTHAEPVAAADASALNRRLEAEIAAAGLPGVVTAPIRVSGLIWGSLITATEAPRGLHPGAERLLARFADLAAVGVASAQTLATLQQQATTDSLTGLLNHRAFQERLQTERRRAIRHARPLALALFDLDGFKEVNDAHGHQTGDRVLVTVARALERASRAEDVAARIGGDEFAVIAPDIDASAALVLTERLRMTAVQAIERLELPVTLSAGVAALNGDAKIDDLVHDADGALYWAKHHGRNRTVVATGDGVAEVEHGVEQERQRQVARGRAMAGLRVLARSVEYREPGAERHADRVAELCEAIAYRLGWTDEDCLRLRDAALLHDLGKIGISEELLVKPSPLSDSERGQIEAHASIGAQILREALDEEQVSWVRSHHERPDGTGYPDRLAGDAIPAGALVLAVAEAFDVIVSGRPYRDARSRAEALAELRAQAGRQFHAAAVEALAGWLAAGDDSLAR